MVANVSWNAASSNNCIQQNDNSSLSVFVEPAPIYELLRNYAASVVAILKFLHPTTCNTL